VAKVTRRIDYIPIREVSNLTVIFYSHEAIYVCDRECVYVFHRWFVYDRTSYSRSFSPFRRFLMERKKITIQEVFERANKYDLAIQKARGLPDLTNRKVRFVR
jgi:hypothetical protein